MGKKNVLDVDDLKLIKKYYGENLAKFCRAKFPTILEHSGVLWKVLSGNFAPTHSLYQDLEQNQQFDKFFNLVFTESLKYLPKAEVYNNYGKSPKELLDMAGYILYPECKSKRDILKFKKYYSYGEELCSFNGDRTQSCRVWFAVKKDAEKIKRTDFSNPQRQDEYGISVISIQFAKDGHNTLSIKNRYNHTVSNPDSTFSNNLDNIVPGLTKAFEDTYGMVQDHVEENDQDFTGYIKSKTGERYRINREYMWTMSCAFCENNVIVDRYGIVKTYDKSRYVLFDNYLLDMKGKNIICLDELALPMEDDAFIESVLMGGTIDKIEINRDGDNKILHIFNSNGKDCFITLSKTNALIGYKNDNITELVNDFLSKAALLEVLDVPNVTKIGDGVLEDNAMLKALNAPKVETIGDNFLMNNISLKELSLSSVKKIGACALRLNCDIKTLDLPNVEEIDEDCFCCNRELESLFAPKLKKMGNYSFNSVKKIKKVYLPSLEYMGYSIFRFNNSIVEFIAPRLKEMENSCFEENKVLNKVNLKSILNLGRDCFKKRKLLKLAINLKIKANNRRVKKEEKLER